MLILLTALGPCSRCDGQMQDGPDGPQCIHCGQHSWSGAEPPPVETDSKESRDTRFADSGCEVARSCFECPLVLCKYELPAVLHVANGTEQNRAEPDL